jgi:hypothetical protein
MFAHSKLKHMLSKKTRKDKEKPLDVSVGGL